MAAAEYGTSKTNAFGICPSTLASKNSLRILSIDVGTRQPGIVVCRVQRDPTTTGVISFELLRTLTDPLVPLSVRSVKTYGTSRMVVRAVEYITKKHRQSILAQLPDVILIEVPKAVKNRQIQVIGHVLQGIFLALIPTAQVFMVSARQKTAHLEGPIAQLAKDDRDVRKEVVCQEMYLMLGMFGHDETAKTIEAHACRRDVFDAIGMAWWWVANAWPVKKGTKRPSRVRFDTVIEREAKIAPEHMHVRKEGKKPRRAQPKRKRGRQQLPARKACRILAVHPVVEIDDTVCAPQEEAKEEVENAHVDIMIPWYLSAFNAGVSKSPRNSAESGTVPDQ